MGFSQNTNIVGLCLIEILALISHHLEFCGLSYGLFTKTGQVAYVQQFWAFLVLDSFGVPNCASNLTWLMAFLGFVLSTKVIALCLSFPMV